MEIEMAPQRKQRKLIMKACVQCGKSFPRQRTWQRFCSLTCRTEFFKDERQAALDKYRDKVDG